MSTQSVFHQQAREYAQQGIPVFPCLESGKEPAVSGGFRAATTDLEQIDAWWSQNPNYNLAFSPETAGWCVIDVDTAKGADVGPLELPDTHTIKTPSGGLHLYFEGSLPSSVNKLGPAIDTRGRGSYVLVPPSVVNGKPYEVIHERDIATIPAAVVSNFRDEGRHVAEANVVLDEPGNIARAQRFLNACIERGDVAVEGQGGNNRTYQCACTILDLGLSEAKAFELIAGDWNSSCNPPWNDEDLRGIVKHAAEYRQNEFGAFAVGLPSDTFKHALENLPEDEQTGGRTRTNFHFEDDEEMDAEIEEAWVVPGILPDNATVMIYGKTQSYKSFLALDLGLAVATGKPAWGIEPTLTGSVFYGALEGRKGLKKKRRTAWRLAREIEGRTSFFIGPAPMVISPTEIEAFKAAIRERLEEWDTPRLIILETVSKMMVGLDPTKDAPKMIWMCEQLQAAFNCTVVAIHHTGHDEDRGPRDSSAYQAGFDTVIKVKAPKKRLAEATIIKHKDYEEPEQPFTFEAKNVGPSLVFEPVSHDHFQNLVEADNPYTRAKVGAALKRLGATEDKPTTTHVLATELIPPRQGEPVEAREASIKSAETELRRLSKRDPMRNYAQLVGRELQWSLPDAVPLGT